MSSYPAADEFCIYWSFTANHNLFWHSTIIKSNGMCSAFVSFISLKLGLSPSRLTAQWATSYWMNKVLGGSERVAGTPRGSVKFRYTIWTSGAVLSSRSSPKPQPPSSSPPLKWEELRWSLPLQAWMLPPLHPPDTTSSHDHFSLLYTLPLLCKDAAQGCNKIHTKVIFHKEKKLRNNCSSNAQQASDSWLPAWGALVMCS